MTVSLKEKFIVSAIKGIVPGDYQTVVEYIHDRYELSYKQLCLFTGPSHAEEVSRGKLSYLTVLIANSAGEMTRFLEESYPDRRDTQVSAYLGDLLVTFYSNYSRNRRVGRHVATKIKAGDSPAVNAEEISLLMPGYRL